MVRVLITEPVDPAVPGLLTQAGHVVDYGPDLTPPAFDAALATAEAVLVRVRPLRVAGPRLRMVAKHGAGVDNIDLAAMAAAGVAVMNTPGANAAAVAELVLTFMLALTRDLPGLMAGGRATPQPGLEGRRLVVVGYGATGRRVARLGAAFGMRVTPVCRPGSAAEGAARADGFDPAPLATALPSADVITLHCPLTPQTRGMLNAAALATLPRGAVVVNCARGGLIDEAALAVALEAGHLGGAGLDVTEVEPLPADHPLCAAPRLILTPHAGGMTQGAFSRMGTEAARNVIDFFAGTPRAACIVQG